MTDFFVRQIPLPLPRPEMEELIPGGTITSRMPLEATEKLTGAFDGVGSYLPSSEPPKLTHGLLFQFKQLLAEMSERMHEMYNNLSGVVHEATWTVGDTLLTIGIVGISAIVGLAVLWAGWAFIQRMRSSK